MSGITQTLVGFPLINQLAEPTSDGQPDEDARENCLVAGIAAALTYYGRPTNGDALHDAVYGQGYLGPQAASAYVGLLDGWGFDLSPVGGSQQQLVATLHQQIPLGRPVLVTMPSQWGIAPSDPLHPVGFTHVGVACGVGPGMVRVMNPWGGFWQDQSDSWWAQRLCFGQVWVMSERVGAIQMAWHTQGNGGGKDDAHHACGAGVMSYLAQHALSTSDGLLSETFYDGNNSFLPLANGRVVTAHHDPAHGTWTVDEQGAQALAAVWQALVSERAQTQQPAALPTPEQAAHTLALAIAAAVKANQPVGL